MFHLTEQITTLVLGLLWPEYVARKSSQEAKVKEAITNSVETRGWPDKATM